MDIVKLVDFVKSGELFEKIEGDFDQIVSDFDFSEMLEAKGFVMIDKIGDLNKINRSKTTLFVLDKLLPENISEYFDMDDFTILDLNFGLSGYGNKVGISKLDLGELIKKNISIYEPFDFISLLGDLELNEREIKRYIRINNLDLPGNFSNGNVDDILTMADYGFSGSSFTIVTTGSMLPEIVRVTHILNQHGLFVDVFVLNKLNFDIDEKMEALISHNTNIMFVLDLINSDIYKKWVKSKLSDVNIKFIYPDYSKLSTIFNEYKFEEAMFDAVGLVERLR